MKVLSIILGVIIAFVVILSSVSSLADNQWHQKFPDNVADITTSLPYIYTISLAYFPWSYKSTDWGLNWDSTYHFVDERLISKCIAVDPFDTAWVYAGFFKMTPLKTGMEMSRNGGRIWRTTNGGYEWVEKYRSPDLASDIHCISVNPQKSNTVYAGFFWAPQQPLVMKSTNSGETWLNPGNNGFSSIYHIYSLAFDPSRAETLYAGTDKGVYRTTDGGVNWTLRGLSNKLVYAIVVNPKNPSILYAGTNDDVYKTTDYGSTWNHITSGPLFYPIKDLSINPDDPNCLYAIRGQWDTPGDTTYVYFYYDTRTSNWIDVTDGLPFHTNHLEIDDLTPDTVYLASNDGVYYYHYNKNFIRGDVKADDGRVTLSDVIFLSNYVLYGSQSPPCLDAADTDDNGKINMGDVVYLSRYLFYGGPPPPPPFGPYPASCGQDPTPDGLDCNYHPCF